MGCPLAPTMANFLFGHFETIMLRKQTPDHPKMYVRYLTIFLHFLPMIMINPCMSFWRSEISNMKIFHTRMRNPKIPCNF